MAKNKNRENVATTTAGETYYVPPTEQAPTDAALNESINANGSGDGADAAAHAGRASEEALTAATGNGRKKPTEPKDVKFRRLANMRVPAALKRIGHVAALANRAQYAYTDYQRDKIIDALKAAVESLEERFLGGKKAPEGWAL